MNMKNSITLIGRLVNDVEVARTSSGTTYSNFSVAVDRPYQKDKERGVDFINCTAWGKTAEFIGQHFDKGSPIMLNGELRQHNYTNKDGVKVFTYVVNVDTIDFALTAKPKNENNSPVQNQNNGNPTTGGFDLSGFEEIYGEGDIPFGV